MERSGWLRVQQFQEPSNRQHLNPVSLKRSDEIQVARQILISRHEIRRPADDGSLHDAIVFAITTEMYRTSCCDEPTCPAQEGQAALCIVFVGEAPTDT